ncbi:MAG: HK97 gp10 family phage protein [Methylobacter sp.]
MGVALLGFDALLASLRNTADRSSRGAREELAKGAEAIKELAIRQAPVDEGNLESAIKTGKSRDLSTGRNNYLVYVDESVDASTPAHPNKTVGDYAEKMHEDPYYNLGIKSENKQANNPDIKVGYKYLERALDELSDDIKRKVESKVSQGIGH